MENGQWLLGTGHYSGWPIASALGLAGDNQPPHPIQSKRRNVVGQSHSSRLVGGFLFSPEESKTPLLSKLLPLPQGCESRFRRAKGGFTWIFKATQLVSHDAEAFRKEEAGGWGWNLSP